MVILELILPMLGLIGKIIPPLRKWLEERNGGYFVWKSEITYWAGRPRSASDKFFGRATDQKAIGDAFKMGNCVVLSGSQLNSPKSPNVKASGLQVVLPQTKH